MSALFIANRRFHGRIDPAACPIKLHSNRWEYYLDDDRQADGLRKIIRLLLDLNAGSSIVILQEYGRKR